jgi:protease I
MRIAYPETVAAHRTFPGRAPAVAESGDHGFERSTMADKLQGKRIAFVAAPEGVEQVELTEPWEAVESEGGTPELLSTEEGHIQAFNHLDRADTFPVDRTVSEASPSDYDALVLPGGVANPDSLRMDEHAVSFIRGFFEQAKPVAVICHGPWTLVEADVVRGRKLTSWPSLKTDIRNAGGTWVDEEVVVDQGLVTSRKPDDLPAFCAKLVEEVVEGKHEAQRRSVGATS